MNQPAGRHTLLNSAGLRAKPAAPPPPAESRDLSQEAFLVKLRQPQDSFLQMLRSLLPDQPEDPAAPPTQPIKEALLRLSRTGKALQALWLAETLPYLAQEQDLSVERLLPVQNCLTFQERMERSSEDHRQGRRDLARSISAVPLANLPDPEQLTALIDQRLKVAWTLQPAPSRRQFLSRPYRAGAQLARLYYEEALARAQTANRRILAQRQPGTKRSMEQT